MKFGKTMSRLAKKAIKIPEGVTLKHEGEFWIFKGPKGDLKKKFSSYADIEEGADGIQISLKKNTPKEAYAMLGTTAAFFKNCVEGVKNGYAKKLEIEGVGYKVQMDGPNLIFALGFSHPIKISAPDGISFKAEKNTIIVSGADKEQVGEIAAKIRSQKPPEPYKGKGIHYFGEVIRRKAGKKAVAAA